jgi:phosphatidylserine/phosphatidylglycerophosphate/cardiolipin synthase-like enzyme
VLDHLTGFVAGAASTLDIAIYDLALETALEQRLCAALADARSRGVTVRLVYNDVGAHRHAYPPPPATRPQSISALGVDARAVSGVPDLMHHKYVVRDAVLPPAKVWTGSANWTTDSWTREENVIVTVASPGVAAAYLRDFEDLWNGSGVEGSGHFDSPWQSVTLEGRTVRVRPHFAPGRGREISHMVAAHLGQARRRVRIASPVLTSGPVLGSLCDLPSSVDARIVYDRTQMQEALSQWRGLEQASWKAAAFEEIMARLPNASKVSTPYAPGSVHDYMHAKLTVCDDYLSVGSYNLSHSGEFNAENVLEIQDAQLADEAASFVDSLFSRYGKGG